MGTVVYRQLDEIETVSIDLRLLAKACFSVVNSRETSGLRTRNLAINPKQ